MNQHIVLPLHVLFVCISLTVIQTKFWRAHVISTLHTITMTNATEHRLHWLYNEQYNTCTVYTYIIHHGMSNKLSSGVVSRFDAICSPVKSRLWFFYFNLMAIDQKCTQITIHVECHTRYKGYSLHVSYKLNVVLPSMDTDDGYRWWLQSMGTEVGYRGWIPSMGTEDGYRAWVPRMATEHGYRGWMMVYRWYSFKLFGVRLLAQ